MKYYLLNILLVFLLNSNFILAKEILDKKNIEYKSYLLGDEKGNVFLGENIKEKMPLASLTKMMTLLVTFDFIESGKIKKEDLVIMDEESNSLGGSRIWIKTGTKISVKDLIKATAIHSANNAAYVLAKYVGHGDVNKFVGLMNEKAKKLGIGEELNYYTPTGLPPSMTGKNMDIGTSEGIYKLSKEALKCKEYIKIASQKKEKILKGQISFKNRNKLLGKEGIYGIKTGHHDAAGYNIAIASKNNNMNIIYVILGSPDEKTRDEKVETDISDFYNDFKHEVILRKDVPLAVIKIKKGTEQFLEVYPDKEVEKIYSKDKKVKIILKLDGEIHAPIEKMEKIGEFELFLDGKKINEGYIISRDRIIKKK
ncbi:MAG: D-alanyl-D-alanine carboxypeptidase family protein [Fusobacterium sp. JB019]|nr:D-alanyl-D-alanine carboxypeptidase family protein [Fusobacterium sp. JB020]MDP0506954.1 D-alanyl-D-alanine carboxypeptidase family protein [Fusobacterium sp. JB019]